MSERENSKAIASNYSCNAKARFEQNGGKLFLVDYAKHDALRTVSAWIPKGQNETWLCVAKDAETASEIADILRPVAGAPHVVDSKEGLQGLLQEAQFSAGDIPGFVQRLKQAHPRLILTATDEKGEALLHAQLCRDATKNGVYNGSNKASPFCLSDALTQCAYDFLIIDTVYDLLSFRQSGEEDGNNYIPGSHDHVNFLGNDYFSDVAHSHKRLKNLVNAAPKAVVLSEVVARENAVELYTVLDMLHPSFSQAAAKARVLSMTQEYTELCERVCVDVAYCKEDDGVLSSCLQRTKNSAQRVPYDIHTMRAYFNKSLSYMSEEELFLRIVGVHADQYGSAFTSMNHLLDMLSGNMDKMSLYLCEAFFRNTLKGELEAVLSTSQLCRLSKQELDSLLRVFLKYGVYHRLPEIASRTRVLRFEHNGSGFEHFVRTFSPRRADEADTYSILHRGNDVVFKCVSISRLLKENKLSLPLLVVADPKNHQEISQLWSQGLQNVSLHTSINEFVRAEKANAALLTDHASLLRTAAPIEAGSIVFLDPSLDVVRQKLLLAKVLCRGNATAVLMAGHEDLSAALLDRWQETLLEDRAAVPVCNTEMSLKDGSWDHYPAILSKLDTLHSRLYRIVCLGSKNEAEAFAKEYNTALLTLTAHSSVPTEDVLLDLDYLADVGAHLEEIYQNTSSIDDAGIKATSQYYQYVEDPERKKHYVEKHLQKTYQKLFFQVCPKMLRGCCDIYQNDCADCADYQAFIMNRPDQLKTNLDEFFKKARAFSDRVKKERLLTNALTTINSTEADDATDRLTVKEITAWRAKADAALTMIEDARAGLQTVFAVDHIAALTVREAAMKAFDKIANKYYKTLADILDVATEKAKTGFFAACDGYDSAQASQ